MSESISIDDAIKRLSSVYVYTPDHTYALQLLKDSFELYRSTGKTVGVVLVGESRTGKSHLLKIFDKYLFENYPPNNRRDKVLISVDVPEKATRREFSSRMLEACGDIFAHKNTTRKEIDDRFRDLTKEMNNVAIAIDEAQQLFHGKSKNGGSNFSQVIKYYFNNINGLIILSGLPEIVKYIIATSELTERFIQVIKLPKYNLDRKDHIATFRSFIREISSVVPFSHECNIKTDLMLLRWMIATDGRIGRAVKLTELACKTAIRRGHTMIDEHHLSEVAATTVFCVSGQENPFDITADEVYEQANEILNKTRLNNAPSNRNPWEYSDDSE